MWNSEIMLRTGGEGRRGSRARVASDVGSEPPVIPTKMFPSTTQEIIGILTTSLNLMK
jgi:hypothetical protein